MFDVGTFFVVSACHIGDFNRARLTAISESGLSGFGCRNMSVGRLLYTRKRADNGDDSLEATIIDQPSAAARRKTR